MKATRNEIVNKKGQIESVVNKLDKLSSDTLNKTGKPLVIDFKFNYCLARNIKLIESFEKDRMGAFRREFRLLQDSAESKKYREERQKIETDASLSQEDKQKGIDKLQEKYKGFIDKITKIQEHSDEFMREEDELELKTIEESCIPKDILTAKDLTIIWDFVIEEPEQKNVKSTARKSSKK